MSDPIADTAPPATPILLEAFGVTGRSVDSAGKPIHVLDRVADGEGVTGIVVAIADRNIVLQVEHGFSDHAADALFATSVDEARVLSPMTNVEDFSAFVADQRSRAETARATDATGTTSVGDEASTDQMPVRIVPGQRVYDETNDSGGIVLLVGEHDVSYLSDTNLDRRIQFDSKPKSQLTVMDIPPLPRDEVDTLLARYSPDTAAEEAVAKVEEAADALEEIADANAEASAADDEMITFAEHFGKRIAAASAVAEQDLHDASTRRSLRNFHREHVLVTRRSRQPGRWEQLHNVLDNWEGLSADVESIEQMREALAEARALIKEAYEEKLKTLTSIAIGARVFDFDNNKTGIVLLNQAEFDRAVILADGDDYEGNVYLDTVDHDQVVVSKAPLVPRDQVMKIVAGMMPGLTTPADVPPIDASEAFAQEVFGDVENRTLPAFGESERKRIPDGSYVFNQATKAVAIALFGNDHSIVIETVGTHVPKALDVWDADFVTVLNLTPVNQQWIGLELSELLGHPNVGDAVGKMNELTGRIILALNSRAIIYWPGNAAMKPSFEARELGKCEQPPFRQYSVAEIQQIIRCHRQLEDAPLAGIARKAGAA